MEAHDLSREDKGQIAEIWELPESEQAVILPMPYQFFPGKYGVTDLLQDRSGPTGCRIDWPYLQNQLLGTGKP